MFLDMETVLFGMGCFWGVERVFWQIEGVISTQVGYSSEYTANPRYEQGIQHLCMLLLLLLPHPHVPHQYNSYGMMG